MNVFSPQIVFQEVPNEVALAFTVCGCPLRCDGCHSQDTWSGSAGTPLTNQAFQHQLTKYQGYISCVLFFGGEWHVKTLCEKLHIAKQAGLKTCLYSGFEKLPKRITCLLDFVKLGAWQAHRGGLEQPSTNQRFIALPSGECLNHLFHHDNNKRALLCNH